MKRALFITLGLAAFVFAAAASAAPATFVFNTSKFDFTDYTLSAGYIGFSMDGNAVQVNLASGAPVSSIPAITLWVPGSTTNAMGQTVYPTLANVGDVTVTSNGGQTTGFTVIHDSVSLNSVVSAYVDALQKIGFKGTEQTSPSANLVIYTFSNNGMQLRAVFHRDGPNVSAHLAGAPAA
ncbi:MAG: hypothetical protein P8Y13_02795 [Deinococcales bacterium]|jgi:hypothetical protein